MGISFYFSNVKKILIVLSILISISIVVLVSLSKGSDTKEVKSESITSNVEIEDGVQIVNVTSTGGGYFPREIYAKANIETVLKMNSENSYGCERSFRIPSLKINQILPTEGVTEIPLGIPKKGQEIFGSCSMGMYTFTINFN